MAILAGSWVKPTVYTLCVLLCLICSVQTTEARRESSKTYLRYYVHENRSGPNATILSAAGPGSGKWGTVLVNDNTVREGESPDSKLIGGATGFGVITTQLGLTGGIMSISKVSFNEASKYNGSTLTLSVTFATLYPPYEAIILGGTGHFRGVRGYGLATPALASPPDYPTKWDIYLSKY